MSVKERLVLSGVDVTGEKRFSEKAVRDLIDLTPGSRSSRATSRVPSTRIDSAYQAAGYFLAKVAPETTAVAGKTLDRVPHR